MRSSVKWSLKTKIALATLVIFLGSLWSLSFYASRMLKRDMELLMGEQQLTAATVVATQINNELRARVTGLEMTARAIDEAMLRNPGALQRFLEQRIVLYSLFNSVVFIVGTDGTAIASMPLWRNITSLNYIDRDYIATTLAEGRSTIGRPVLGKELKTPLVGIATPIFNATGQVIGVLAGVTDLSYPNFLQKITENPHGQSGGYFLISPQDRRVVTGPDISDLMHAVPNAGACALLDRFVSGYQGSGVLACPGHPEKLASAKRVPVADWFVMATLPTTEAFRPIRNMQHGMLLATLVLTVLAVTSLWWMLRRQLAPLTVTAQTLLAMSEEEIPLHDLPRTRPDEIGVLVDRFNNLLSTLRARETALRTSEQRFRDFTHTSADWAWEVDAQGRYTFVSDKATNLLGYTTDELLGKTVFDIVPVEKACRLKSLYASIVAKKSLIDDLENTVLHKDGSPRHVLTSAVPLFDENGAFRGYRGTDKDITERKQAETTLKSVMEAANDAIIVIDPRGRITYWNAAASKIFGYSEDEVMGGVLHDLIVPPQYMADHRVAFGMFQRTGNGKAVGRTMALQARRKDGQDISVELSLASVQLNTGWNAIGIIRDVTERKHAEKQQQLAATVFTHAREGIVITAPDGTILEVNHAFSEITGYAREEALGRNPRLLNSGQHDKSFFEALWRDLHEKGEWYGEIWNRRKKGEIYAELLGISAVRDSQGRIQHYLGIFSDITALKTQQKQLEHIAHYDALTALPNRVLLADRLKQAMAHTSRRGTCLGVAYLDLDRFKNINDKYGHAVGDQVLMALASHMSETLREGDTLARMGGDEFVAVFQDLVEAEASIPLLERLLTSATVPVPVGDDTHRVSASIGVAFYPQSEEVDADQLLRQADQAMYQAKLAGKNRYHFFDPDQDRNVRGLHESLERIRLALMQREFILHYQPKVNMRTGEVVGAEALIRWQHPERGLVSPGEFLPVIETHPLAVDIGEWVMHEALTQIERWQEAGLNISVSVNVGAHQLQQRNFVEHLREILAAHTSVRCNQLMLEVLETSALEDLAHISRVIEQCRTLGVSFALDDFGTGYSSLTYLKRLPVYKLKIDQSFVRDMLDDPDDLAILQGILGLATAFRRQVIAEGVETVAHGELLLQLGCELAQGYGIARPMPGADILAWIKNWQPASAWKGRQPAHRDDWPLLFAPTEHRAWIFAMESYVKGERETPPSHDPEQCRFGQWLYSTGREQYGDRPLFHAIERLHREMHSVASALCENQPPELRSPEQILAEVKRYLNELIENEKTLLG